ncbi:12553_t:CDS:2 [Acaulospora colombiana]|uniref:12553_t:CDS:1 n=1 Tax=Acaulospora colombiana TaxID=27376 RepID=A0ACA9JX68_9GLOM|nr:12553_t:CDS:2 [Acaulospora colombiana]
MQTKRSQFNRHLGGKVDSGETLMRSSLLHLRYVYSSEEQPFQKTSVPTHLSLNFNRPSNKIRRVLIHLSSRISRELVLTKKPNKAHKALVDFENAISSQSPQAQTFFVLTQNVDGLSSNIKNLVEIHALKGTENKNFDTDIPIEQLPTCSKCQGLLRPDVVWFHEHLSQDIARTIEFELNRCDLLLVIGTSGIVYPAAGYLSWVSSRGGKVANFNVEEMEMHSDVIDFEL